MERPDTSTCNGVLSAAFDGRTRAPYGASLDGRSSSQTPVVAEVVARGGHSTYRVVGDADRFARRWPTLSAHGCTFERANATLVAIDVPPEAAIHDVYRALEAGERAGDWDFEEGHCGHPV